MALELVDVSKAYEEGPEPTPVLHELQLRVQQGELVAITGPSGSGKSTLLNLVGLLDRPTTGEIRVRGQCTTQLTDRERTRLRGETLGFVFQFHHLLPALSAEENVAMAIAIREGRMTRRARVRAREVLDRLSIADLARRKPQEMSGGQRQRVAIARAIVTEPALIVADEPTGNLDTETGAAVFTELARLNRELHLTLLLVTHEDRLAQRCDRVVHLVDGRIRSDTRPAPSGT